MTDYAIYVNATPIVEVLLDGGNKMLAFVGLENAVEYLVRKGVEL